MLGFSLSSNRERYLSGIEEWKKSNSGSEFIPSELFKDENEKSGFFSWCRRTEVSIDTEEKLLSAILKYKQLRDYKEKVKIYAG